MHLSHQHRRGLKISFAFLVFISILTADSVIEGVGVFAAGSALLALLGLAAAYGNRDTPPA